MKVSYEIRPLVTWPGKKTADRERSRFSAEFHKTQDLLDRELDHLGAKHAVLQLDVGADDLRLDGTLRAGVRPKSPAVILSFETRRGPLSYPCDRFASWQENVRAIALALEALRSVDRYGVTSAGEQYKGWAALPDKSEEDGPQNGHDARSFIASITGLWHEPEAESILRQAEMKTHPDRGGDPALFVKVQRARQLILGVGK